MPLDGYFVAKLIEEIKLEINNSFLRRIKMPSKRAFLFEFYKNKPNYLYIDLSSNNPHLRLSENLDNISDSVFISNLKRLLLNSKLVDIVRYKKDRIIKFVFLSSDPFLGNIKRELILEIMGRNSNLILVEDNIIIDAYLKRFSEIHRSILPKLKYEPFPTEKSIFKFEDLPKYTSSKDLFNKNMGFSMDLATFVYNYKIDIDNEPLKPVKYEDNKFHAFDLRLDNPTYYESLSSLLKDVYKKIEPINPLYKQLNKELKNRENRLKNLKVDLEDNKNYDKYKITADMIYSSGLDLNSKMTEYLENPLDYKLTLNENAQKLYRIYKKKKASLDHLKREISLTELEIKYYSDLITNFDNLDLDDLKLELNNKLSRKKKDTKKSHYFYNGNGYQIHVGKSNFQNEYLTHKLANPEDLWFHVKDYPGSHVILRGNISDEAIKKAAYYAAKGSPLKDTSNVLVIYTKVKYVKKIKGMKGFYVSYKNEKGIYIDT
ncbi:MAG: DUF814 domain-containing protein [Acholeplasmataceae bacterium]|nr:DUF814 domain-containing protein [Acholeplasmataceae bacterium]